MLPNPPFPGDLVTFIGKIFNGKLHFLTSKIQRTLFSAEYQLKYKKTTLYIHQIFHFILAVLKTVK